MSRTRVIRAALLAAFVAGCTRSVSAAGPFQLRRATTAQAVSAAPPLATIATSPFDGEPVVVGGPSYYYGVYDAAGHALDISVQTLPASHTLRIGFDDSNPASAPVSAALSSLTVVPASIRADGIQFATIAITPRDANGVLLGRGLSITIDSTFLWPAQVSGPVVDLGNGSYAATAVANVPGTGSVRVVVEGVALWSLPTITATTVDPQASLRDLAIAGLGGMAAAGGPLATLAAGAGSGTSQATSINLAIFNANVARWALVNGTASHDDFVLQTTVKGALRQLSLVLANPGALNPLDVRDAMDDLFEISSQLAQWHMDQAVAACGACGPSGNPHNVCAAGAAMDAADTLRGAINPDWSAIVDAYTSAIQASDQSLQSC